MRAPPGRGGGRRTTRLQCAQVDAFAVAVGNQDGRKPGKIFCRQVVPLLQWNGLQRQVGDRAPRKVQRLRWPQVTRGFGETRGRGRRTWEYLTASSATTATRPAGARCVSTRWTDGREEMPPPRPPCRQGGSRTRRRVTVAACRKPRGGAKGRTKDATPPPPSPFFSICAEQSVDPESSSAAAVASPRSPRIPDGTARIRSPPRRPNPSCSISLPGEQWLAATLRSRGENR